MANEMDDKKLCMGCMRMRKEAKEKCPYCGFDEKKGDREDNEALPLRTELNGKYLLGKPLGRGGFGITYIAYEKNLQIRVAIKEFFPVVYSKKGQRQFTHAGIMERGFRIL